MLAVVWQPGLVAIWYSRARIDTHMAQKPRGKTHLDTQNDTQHNVSHVPCLQTEIKWNDIALKTWFSYYTHVSLVIDSLFLTAR